jgi:hypothetical protein
MLSRLSAGGRPEWSLVANDRLQFREREFGPPWPTDDFAVYRAGGETECVSCPPGNPLHYFVFPRYFDISRRTVSRRKFDCGSE